MENEGTRGPGGRRGERPTGGFRGPGRGPRPGDRGRERGIMDQYATGGKPAGYGGNHDTHTWDGTPSQQIEHRNDDYRAPHQDTPAMVVPETLPDAPSWTPATPAASFVAESDAMPQNPMGGFVAPETMAPAAPQAPRWRKRG